MKPVGKPDALIGHVRFDERGWETGRRLSASARAHPRLYLQSAWPERSGLLDKADITGGTSPLPGGLHGS